MDAKILPTDPKAGYLAHKQEIDDAVRRVCEKGWYILGDEVDQFEGEFASYVGVAHGIGVASGTDAIELALRACGVGRDSVVLTVSHTAVATVAAIERCGASVALVDIDPATFTIDVKELERAYASCAGRAAAIVPVHLYGHPADMPAITEFARRHDLYVIEDCAQAHGAQIDGKKVGAWGHLAAFSFYPTKNLGGLGDGGMVVTDDVALGEATKALREYGWKQRYISDTPGINSRLDELQAAILRIRLRYLDQENAERQRLAAVYDSHLAAAGLVLPATTPGCTHVYHQYVVRTSHRDVLREHLNRHGIGTLSHYPAAVHQQPAYANLPQATSLHQTEQVVAEILSLPMYPQFDEKRAAMVAEQVLAWSQQHREALAGEAER